jgi:hypothetical protein
MKRKLYTHISYMTLAFGILLFLSGCNAKSTELKAMLESSVATTQLTTGSEVSRQYQDRQTKPLLGKPKQPEVRIEYEPINNYTKEDVYDEIVGILEKNDWEREELSIAQPGYYKASLPQDDFTIVAEVLIHSKSNIVSINLGTIPR